MIFLKKVQWRHPYFQLPYMIGPERFDDEMLAVAVSMQRCPGILLSWRGCSPQPKGVSIDNVVVGAVLLMNV